MLESIRETIESVESVSNCRIVESKGVIEQVYVDSEISAVNENERTQKIKAIVRSIIGAVAIKHDIDLDYRKIKVIEYKADNNHTQDFHPRVCIVAAYQKRYPVQESVVELNCFNKIYTGTALSTGDEGKSIFNAFADAFAQTDLGAVSLVYMETLTIGLNHERLILIKVNYCRPDGQREQLLGVAEIKEDLPLAVVKAVLNAINRQIMVSIELPTRT